MFVEHNWQRKNIKELENSGLEFGTQYPAPDVLLKSSKPDAHKML